MMLCLPCQPGKPEPHECEARRGAITPCECPVCWPSDAASGPQGDETASDYAQRLLDEHGVVTDIHTARAWTNVDTGGRL